jgi:uncharacterized membrane protein
MAVEASRTGKACKVGFAMMSWLLALPLLGLATGLRTMTPIAALCWFAYLGYLPVDGTWAAWTARLVTAIVFTVLALGEYIGDKLPKTPNRTSVVPLLARLVFGGLVGSIAATSMNGAGLEGVLLGVLGALVGAFGGYMLRRDLVEKLDCADWKYAVCEDLTAIAAAIFALHVITM